MKNVLKMSLISAAVAAMSSGAVWADTAETKGGITIKTDDGRFEAKIGGRIHFDAYLLDDETGAAFGSRSGGSTNFDERSGTFFRRAYLTLTGKLYGWKYKFENDFAAQTSSASAPATTCTTVQGPPVATTCTTAAPTVTNSLGFREMWVSTQVGPGELVIGQFKPYRGMEELTSSNDITMIERPVTTATGIYAGRQFLMGLGYKGIIADQLGYGVHAMSLNGANASNNTTEGTSYGGRAYWFPLSADGSTVHLGISGSVDDVDTGSVAAAPSFGYAGRRGPTVAFGSAGSANTGANAGQTANSQTTLAVEGAASFGPWTLQAEYATADLDNSRTVGGAPEDSSVDAYYLQASWFVTGESKSYKKDRGGFGAPKPAGDWGALELTARYESIENSDADATTPICTPSNSISGGATASSCEVSVITLGANWYVNPNVRFMLNYYLGEADLGLTGGSNQTNDEPNAITLRTQLSF